MRLVVCHWHIDGRIHMSSFTSRKLVLVLAAFAVGLSGLWVSQPASADKSLFRVERTFRGAPFPAVTSPGGAGVYQNYLEPYTYLPYPEATVEPGNPIGGAFTLPTGFIDFIGTFTLTAKTAFPGYTSISGLNYYNGPGYFAAGHGAASPTRVVFPTTGGNPTPNYGTGNPVTPTTTFSGRYDFQRAGSINVTPGPRRFGGTLQMFYRSTSFFYQYIYYFAPAYYKAYGSFLCQNPPKVTCYAGSVSNIGDVTSSGMVTRFLLNVKGTGTGMQVGDNTAKATTAIDPTYGTFPTPYGNASFIVAKNYYLHLIHPWTTGFASVYNPLETPFRITPQEQGYDVNLGGADITVTHIYTSANFNSTLSTVTYTQLTYKQYMNSVNRVVSMVRPRLKHVYQKPLDLSTDPIISNFQAARLYTIRVFFVPEAAGALMLGAGLTILLALARMRRR
jgi:hypothetical protein